jgi:hypothetical protein
MRAQDQARRDRAAAGLDAAGLVEQQDLAALGGEIGRRCRAGWSAADHDHIEGLNMAHARCSSLRPSATAPEWMGEMPRFSSALESAAMRAAIRAAAMNRMASPVKTEA